MKLFVGLGNPGKEYENTRHNIGFNVIDMYAKMNKLDKFKEKFNGLYIKCDIGNEQVILLKPLSFMNLSGTVVKKFVDYYHIELNDIYIIQDDLDLPVGKIKLKLNGSSGGHNGINNIIENLGTEIFKRIKIGIANNKNMDTKDYVLGHFSKEDNEILDRSYIKCVDIIKDCCSISFNHVMSKYNGANNEIS